MDQWIGERREFAAFVENEVKANLENLRHQYKCPGCDRLVQCKQRLQPGAACFVCCALNNNGRWLKTAVLIYLVLQATVKSDIPEDGDEPK